MIRPDVQKIGFALFLSVNATSAWGGIFPYLPGDLQTSATTMAFYGLQLAAFAASYLLFMFSTCRRLEMTRQVRVLRGAVPLSLSGLALVASMYVPAGNMALIVGAALLLGFGAAYFMATWQKVFASEDPVRAGTALIVGFGYSALAYMLLCLIPVALTAYLMPLVLVPLAALCLWMAAREMDYDQTMFTDDPAKNAKVYRNAVRSSFPAALCIGALGFCAGAVRFISIGHQAMASFINLASMGVLLVVAFGYLCVWSARAIRFDVMNFYRILFPVVGAGLFLLPFSTTETLAVVGAAMSYACFMLALMMMMVHCCQIARDNGIDPVFIFAFYGMVVYLMELAGYSVGFVSGADFAFAGNGLSLVTSASLLVLLVSALLAGRSNTLLTQLDFLPQGALLVHGADLPEILDVDFAEAPVAGGALGDSGGVASVAAAPVAAPVSMPSVVDRTEDACRRAAENFGLSSREEEVMGLMARGKTGPMIADELFISENTVRTHIKRIYAKMGVGKKKEMLAIVDALARNVDAPEEPGMQPGAPLALRAQA